MSNNPFADMKSEGLEEQQDRLGGFDPFKTDIYTGPIKLMYATKSDKGAGGVVTIVDIGGKEFRITEWVRTKDGKNSFQRRDHKPGDKPSPLPGFTNINDILLVTTTKELSEQTVEEKIVKIYNPESKKEEPQSAMVFVDAIGKEVTLAITEVFENQTELQNGEYVPIAKTRKTNEISKVFQTSTKRTVAEIRRQDETATFHDSWLERNRGNVKDKRTIKDDDGVQSGRPGSGEPPKGGNSEKKSLFA